MPTFRGFPACDCLTEWLPVYERMLQLHGVLDGGESLRIYQLIGGASASAGTHSRGGAFDITDLVGEKDVWIARQMGADATWARTAAQGFTPHLHGVLRGCPHNAPARYQIDAVDDGYNGLGRGGRGGTDDGPRPLSGRDWRQGIEWAKQQEEDDMANSDEILAVLQRVETRLANQGKRDVDWEGREIRRDRAAAARDQALLAAAGRLEAAALRLEQALAKHDGA